MKPSGSSEHSVLENAVWSVLVSGALLSVLSLYWFGWRGAVASLVGGFVAAANLWVVARIVRGLLSEDGTRSRWSLLAVLKLGALIGGLFLLITHGLTPILPLALGYAALPIGIVFAQLWTPAPVADKS